MKPTPKKAMAGAFIVYAPFVYFYALFFASEDVIAGQPFFQWAIWCAYAMLGTGLMLGTLQVVSRRKQKNLEEARAAQAESDNENQANRSGSQAV